MTKKELVDQLQRFPDDTQLQFVAELAIEPYTEEGEMYFDINNKIEILEGETWRVILREDRDDE